MVSKQSIEKCLHWYSENLKSSTKQTVAKQSAMGTKQEALSNYKTSSRTENEHFELDSIPWLGKVTVFIGFPTACGFLGLFLSYLQSFRELDRDISFDRDFSGPFLLGLAAAAVVAIRTSMFRASPMKSAILWPKVGRVKKIVYNSQLEHQKQQEPPNLSSTSITADKKKN